MATPTAPRGLRTPLRRIVGAFAALAFISGSVSVSAETATQQREGTVMCTDVGVQMHIRRLAAMPLQELSELQTGKSCVKTTIMATITEQAERMLKNAALQVLDCVTTRIDEELLGLYSVMRVCPQAEAATDQSAWESYLGTQLPQIFAPKSGGPGRESPLAYYQSSVQCEQLAISKSYERAQDDQSDSKENTPRFKFKAAELSTSPADSVPERTLVVLQLRVKNDGAVPLHVFAATVKATSDVGHLNGALVLLPDSVEPVAPKADALVTLKAQVQRAVELEDGAIYAVYFAHTASRAHLLEAKLDGTKLKVIDKKKFSSKTKKDSGFANTKFDDTVSLEGAYASFPYGAWQLMSVGVVMFVGIVTTVYMRRKWTRVHWMRSLDCFNSKALKHKTSSLEMSSKRAAYDPEDPSDATIDALESDGFLSSSNESFEKPAPAEIKRPTSKLREKMPAITMHWKKPAILREKLSIRRALKLDASARIDPKRFENLWDEFIQRHNASFEAAKRPTTEVFMVSMSKVGISCLASGTVNGVEKYVLYAKQADTNDFFFLSVDILCSTNETNVSVRSSKDTHESLVSQFVALMDQQLGSLLK